MVVVAGGGGGRCMDGADLSRPRRFSMLFQSFLLLRLGLPVIVGVVVGNVFLITLHCTAVEATAAFLHGLFTFRGLVADKTA